MGWAFVPLTAATLVALLVAALHRRLRPEFAARGLTAALLLVGTAAVPSLWIVSLGFLGHLPMFGHFIRWCGSAAGIDEPISPFLGIPAVALSMLGLVRTVQVSTAYRRMRGTRQETVQVITEDDPMAYTLPGRAGRVVISSGLVSMLDIDELAVVLAHERAHGVHRHDRMVLLARLSQAAIPLLRPLSDRLLFTLERWADEEAVCATGGDRRFVARTIAKVALRSSAPASALAIAGLGVPARVDALLQSDPGHGSCAITTSIRAAIVFTALLAGYQLHHLAGLVVALCPR